MANKVDNLMPIEEVNSRRTREQHSKDSSKGGIASGEARSKKATMLSILEGTLDKTNSKGLTYRELATLGLIKGAMNGKVENYKFILEMLGELNTFNNGDINNNINNIANLINNPKPNRTEADIDV